MLAFAITLLIIIIYSGLFILTGHYVLEKTAKDICKKFHILFRVGANFFIGYAVFLSSWVITAHLTNNVKISLLCITVLSFIIGASILLRPNTLIELKAVPKLFLFLLFLFLITFGTLRALTPLHYYVESNPEYVNPFLGFGSFAHSFRAGNITQYTIKENSLPLINQHSGQSILATIPVFVKQQSDQLSLILWLNVFVGFFIITIYGFIKYFVKNKLDVVVSLSVVLLGSTILSPFYTSITDTESVLLLSTNIDSIFGIISFFILLLFIFFNAEKDNNIGLVFLTAILCFIWNITSGQMIVLLLLSLLVIFVISGKNNFRSLQVVKLAFVAVISSLVGVFFLGGMLSPFLANNTKDIPGLMSLKNDKPFISLRFPKTGEGYQQTWSKFSELYKTITSDIEKQNTIVNTTKVESITSDIKRNSVMWGVAKLIRSVQLVFFPLLGLYLAYYFYIKNKLNFSERPLFKFLLIQTSVLFVAGWITSSIFELYGYFWELSKLFYIGVFMSMLLLGLTSVMYYRETRTTWHKLVLVAIFFFIIAGPTSEYFIYRPLANIYLHADTVSPVPNILLDNNSSSRTLSLTERFHLLTNSSVIYGTNLEN